jgi:hypothetical protein
MLKRGDIVFIDTNAIAAAHSVKAWAAIRSAFKLITALVCTEEVTRPNRYGDVLVEKTAESLAQELEIRIVDDAMRFVLLEKLGEAVALDAGERDLLALAVAQGRGVWCFCGPDKATLRALHCLGWADRMVSLEQMMRLVGVDAKGLQRSLTQSWLEEKRTILKLGDMQI